MFDVEFKAIPFRKGGKVAFFHMQTIVQPTKLSAAKVPRRRVEVRRVPYCVPYFGPHPAGCKWLSQAVTRF